MNHIRQAHSDIVHFATFTTPVLIWVRSTNDGTTHDYAIFAFASANHIEFVTYMGFLIVPDAPVVVESVIEEVLHGILKLRQLIVADVRVPAHDEGLAEVLTNDTRSLIKQFIPLFIIHLVKQSLCVIQELEFILFLHQVAEILEFHHLAGITLHHAYILADSDEHILRIVNHSDGAQFLFFSNMSSFFPDVDSLQIRPLNSNEISKGILDSVGNFVPSNI